MCILHFHTYACPQHNCSVRATTRFSVSVMCYVYVWCCGAGNKLQMKFPYACFSHRNQKFWSMFTEMEFQNAPQADLFLGKSVWPVSILLFSCFTFPQLWQQHIYFFCNARHDLVEPSARKDMGSEFKDFGHFLPYQRKTQKMSWHFRRKLDIDVCDIEAE